MASKVIVATLLLACFACASATDGKESQGLSITITGEKSHEQMAQEALQSKADHISAWANFGKDCKCEDKCVDRVKTICKATMVPEEVCVDVEKETPIVKCKTVCTPPPEGKTVLITLPNLTKGRKLRTGSDISGHGLVVTKKSDDSDAKPDCKEKCEDSTKKDKVKKCETVKKEKLDCQDKKEGQDCEKVCTCNGIVTRTKKVPLFSLTKGL